MKVIIQDGTEIDINGEVTLKNNKLLYKNKIIGIYENREKATIVFSEMICHGWNNESCIYKMPIN